MRKRNPHNFPVLQQDIPAHNTPNGLPQPQARKTKKPRQVQSHPPNPVQAPLQTQTQGEGRNFFDEVVVQDENRKEGETGNVIQQEQKKEKKKLFTFQPDLLLDPKKGLKALYMNIDKFNLVKTEPQDQNKNPKPNKNSDEFQLLHKMMRLVKDWHFLCMPKYDFQYFLSRCQDFGSKPILKSHLSRMRKIHKGLMRWEDIEDNLEEGQGNVDQNPSVPQEILNNVRNGNVRNQNLDGNQSPNHNQNREIPESNRDPTLNHTNQSQINVTNNQESQDQFYEEIPQDIMGGGEDEKDIPAEFLNAPDIDFDDDIDDNIELDYFDLERERKKVKTDENHS